MSNAEQNEQQLWIRFVCGDSLTSLEGERLVDWLDDSNLREVFLDDLKTDRVLRSLGALEPTQEHFIDRTLESLGHGDAALQRGPAVGTAWKPWWKVAGLVFAAAALAFAVGINIGRDTESDGLIPNDQPFVWATTPDPDLSPTRHGTGFMELPAGETRLAFDSGATVDVDGPATLELVDDDELLLLTGQAQASVPSELAAFVVRTPTARIVDSGVTFHFRVKDAGDTEVHIITGELNVEAGHQGSWSGFSQHLSAADLLRANVTALIPDSAANVMVLEAEGDAGSYSGLIVAEGQALEFGGRDALDTARAAVRSLYLEGPDNFSTQWRRIAVSGSPTWISFEGQAPEMFRVDELNRLGHALSITIDVESDGQLELHSGAEVPVGDPSLGIGLDGAHGHVLQNLPGGLSRSFAAGIFVREGEEIPFTSPGELFELIEARIEPLSPLFFGSGDWTSAPGVGRQRVMIELRTRTDQ